VIQMSLDEASIQLFEGPIDVIAEQRLGAAAGGAAGAPQDRLDHVFALLLGHFTFGSWSILSFSILAVGSY